MVRALLHPDQAFEVCFLQTGLRFLFFPKKDPVGRASS